MRNRLTIVWKTKAMKRLSTLQVTSRGFDYACLQFAIVVGAVMTVFFGYFSIQTGEGWFVTIFFAFLTAINFLHALRMRRKMKNCEHAVEAKPVGTSGSNDEGHSDASA